MLTLICPNCRHRFSTPGCCLEASNVASLQRNVAEAREERSLNDATPPIITTTNCYAGGILAPRGFTNGVDLTSGGDCFIKAPTIIQGPVVIQSGVHCGSTVSIAGPETIELPYDVLHSSATEAARALATAAAAAAVAESSCYPQLNLLNDSTSLIVKTKNVEYGTLPSIEQQRVATTCDLTGGNVTITPDIQSGGCMIQNMDGGVLVQAPHIEIRPKLTGGGCLVQKRLSTEDEQLPMPKYNTTNVLLNTDGNVHRRMFIDFAPPGLLSESRGTFDSVQSGDNAMTSTRTRQCKMPNAIRMNDVCRNCSSAVHQLNLCQSSNEISNVDITNDRNGMQIQVNATVQLPANMGECRLNITATTQSDQATMQQSSDQVAKMEPTRAESTNFNAQDNTSTQTDEADALKNRSILSDNIERRDGAPTTPVSWLMPYPWSLAEQANRNLNRLHEIKELLRMCGWYHEGMSWQQSENLLKHAPVGRWLMRDSSDSRYTFAVSVQTNRGPTSIRVYYFLGGFRFDAEPRMALAMPFFSCPINMLEHYVEYSKKMNEQRKEVWVDYSGQMYSQIYLTQPLLKEVRPLSHLARLVVNRHKLPIEHLPLIIRNYIVEYPYTL
jgi:suppressor of cytokine signaling 2